VDPHDNIVAGLVEFYTRAEIQAQWRDVHASLLQRAGETVTIVAKSVDGRTTTGVTLSTPEEKHAYIAACRDAIARIDGDPAASARRNLTDFREGPVLV
jgi:ABC-type microcin C transport system duplicated ATPase subunit YejF